VIGRVVDPDDPVEEPESKGRELLDQTVSFRLEFVTEYLIREEYQKSCQF
jgi:hypothetical protein